MLRLVDPLLFVLLSATHDELARQVQFLRAENRMLRARLPTKVRLTEPERWVKSVRLECLDHFVAFGERHLEYLLRQYVEHYHQERPHQGLDNRVLPRDPRTPRSRSSEPPSRAGPSSWEFPPIVRRQRLGGVLKHYERAA